MKPSLSAAMTAALLSLSGPAAAGEAPPDWSAARAHIQAAERLAGSEWGKTVSQFCLPGGPANDITDPTVEPTKIFDNVYFIGDTGTLVYAIDTPDGIILIDTLYREKLDSVLLPGMKALGLDPARVKLVLVTHGHADHYGNSAYFQKTYGAHVGVSALDWDLMDGQRGVKPTRDLVLEDGKPVTFGGVSVTPIFIPGHTPGSMGFIFPVQDHGVQRMAGMFGSSLLRLYRNAPPELTTFRNNLRRFQAAAAKAGVEVELQNHPIFDGHFDKAAKLKAAPAGAPNPFVVGKDGYRRFMQVAIECTGANLARKGADGP